MNTPYIPTVSPMQLYDSGDIFEYYRKDAALRKAMVAQGVPEELMCYKDSCERVTKPVMPTTPARRYILRLRPRKCGVSSAAAANMRLGREVLC